MYQRSADVMMAALSIGGNISKQYTVQVPEQADRCDFFQMSTDFSVPLGLKCSMPLRCSFRFLYPIHQE